MTQVVEPDPGNLPNGTLPTYYTYDVLNQLRTVSMTRAGTTQTRTFTYGSYSASNQGILAVNGVGPFLMSAANPENGTVNNTYNSDSTLAYQIDAKGQKIGYSYDSYKRVTQISKYPDGVNEDVCQRVTYFFDTNPDDASYTQWSAGRLTAIHYAGANCKYVPPLQGQTSVTGNNYIEMFSYTQAGDITNKKLRLWKQVGTNGSPTTALADLEAVYTYSSEGKINTLKYPLGTTYQFGYDSMGRPTKMTDMQTTTDLVGTVTYGPAGELLSIGGAAISETREYNVMGQLTQLNGTGLARTYNYPAAGANNGQMASQQDLISGEVISYQYDVLKRLSSSTSNQGWGQGFTYDGFGNLTGKSALSGNPPIGTYAVDPLKNRLTNTNYDANGNQTSIQGSVGQQMYYDVSNRMTGGFGIQAGQGAAFEYDIGNQRIYQSKQTYNGSAWVQQSEEWYFYGITGQKLGTYQATLSGTTLSWAAVSAQVFFGPKLIRGASGNVQEDIRGSIGAYFAYGEDRGGGLGNDAVKFATYTRDSMTGLDYASQRYHLPGMGRFAGVDPFGGSASAGDPGSWNRFTYVGGDPVNLMDPTGECGQYDSTFCVTSTGMSPGTSFTTYFTPAQLCLYSPGGGCYCASVNAANAAIANAQIGFGGAAPRGPVVPIDSKTMQHELNQAMASAVLLLLQNSACASLFGLVGAQGQSSPPPAQVLAMIANSFVFGPIATPAAAGANVVTSATTLGVGNASIPIQGVPGTTIAVNSGVQITLNNTSQGASYVSGTLSDWEATLLHELGHAYWDLFGPGTSQILPDGNQTPGNVAQSATNTALIKKRCGL